ncbi:TAT-variant-translocated molybdopterin oxidoreductase [bacterium]|nr:TAT-variant-translocated molybdopterin oxidoreductase [bacterium]
MNKTYWRSLNELHDKPEFLEILHREFPQAAAEYPDGISRRRWLQLMGASLALGGMAGCRWEKEVIAPELSRDPNRIPGVPVMYATAREHAGFGEALLVRSYDGRPTKVEGNPEHPASLGATTQFAQASILELYDPDRLDSVKHRVDGKEEPKSWADFQASVMPLLERSGDGGSIAFLVEASSSPSFADMKKRFLAKYPAAKWFEYESISRDHDVAGAMAAFGQPARTHLKLADANVVVALDSDLLRSHPNALVHTRDWAARRDPDHASGMIRLYSFESQFSITGANADHRVPVRSSEIAAVLATLESLVEEGLGSAEAILAKLAKESEPRTKTILAAAHDLVTHPGTSVVSIGPGQPPALHARVHRLNARLQNVGKTVIYTDEPNGGRPSHVESLKSLVEAMRAKMIGTLFIVGGNPAYTAPADVDFVGALKSVDHPIRLGGYDDETAVLCEWALPMAHAFESWSDTRTYDGTVTLIQPLIEPLHGGRSAIETIALLLGDTAPEVSSELAKSLGERIVRRTSLAWVGSDEAKWKKSLHDGFFADSVLLPVNVTVKPEIKPGEEQLGGASPTNGKLEIVFSESSHTFDGRFANNGWLMETPDFITKMTWENVAILSPKTAEDLNVKDATLISLEHAGQKIELPAYVLPGQAYGSIGVQLGFGRRMAGVVGGYVPAELKSVGVDVTPLRSAPGMGFASGAKVVPLGKEIRFATTQDHFSIDPLGDEEIQRRSHELIREANLDEYKSHPDFAKHVVHHPPLLSLWKSPLNPNEPHRWGMTIDLAKCTGCNACITACQSENNIPIVGKEQVTRSRELHWIRIDRYFRGDKENPEVVCQPLTCQQCENAPCEQVCPVAATVHSDEGLNDMVYNRCIGTRYCANNCPYKVRRFNYFHFTGYLDKAKEGNEILRRMVLNPEVTVRTRGVMEKCTYCVQRISSAKIQAKNAQRAIVDGEVRSACQQVCPADAIVFGNLADENSRVAKLQKGDRSYALLGEINTLPRTLYLARIRNPHPALAVARLKPHGQEHHQEDGHEHGHEHPEGVDHAPAEAKHS